jgi:hypothetical protein
METLADLRREYGIVQSRLTLIKDNLPVIEDYEKVSFKYVKMITIGKVDAETLETLENLYAKYPIIEEYRALYERFGILEQEIANIEYRKKVENIEDKPVKQENCRHPIWLKPSGITQEKKEISKCAACGLTTRSHNLPKEKIIFIDTYFISLKKAYEILSKRYKELLERECTISDTITILRQLYRDTIYPRS